MGYLTSFISYLGLPVPHKVSGIVIMVVFTPDSKETQGGGKSLLHSSISTCTIWEQNR